MDEERLIDFSEALEDGGVSRKLLADFDESQNNKDAHSDRVGTVQDIGRLQGAVLGEGVWAIARVTMLRGTGRKLRPVRIT